MSIIQQKLRNIDFKNPSELKTVLKFIFKQRIIALRLNGLKVSEAQNELKRDLQDFIFIFSSEYKNRYAINNTNLERFINVNVKLKEELLNLRKSMNYKNLGTCKKELDEMLKRNFGVKLR